MQDARIRALGTLLVIAAMLFASGAASGVEEAAGTITGLSGTAHAGDQQAFGQHAALPEDGQVVTEDDGNCSILLDENALLEMCGETAVQLTRRPGTKKRIVRLDAGELRMTVEPRGADELIEIHTPAAIATILGSIVHMRYDPVTGEVWMSSSESDMKIVAGEEFQQQYPGSTVLSAGQEMRFIKGQDPTQIEKRALTRQAMANLTDCLENMREAAVRSDHVRSSASAQDRIAVADTEAVSGEDVATAAGVTPGTGGVETPSGPDNPGSGQNPVQEPTDSAGASGDFDTMNMEVDPDPGNQFPGFP